MVVGFSSIKKVYRSFLFQKMQFHVHVSLQDVHKKFFLPTEIVEKKLL